MKLKALVLAALLVGVTGAAHAQSTSLGLMGGVGIPTGDFGDVADPGYYVGVNGAYMFNPQFGIGVALELRGKALETLYRT